MAQSVARIFSNVYSICWHIFYLFYFQEFLPSIVNLKNSSKIIKHCRDFIETGKKVSKKLDISMYEIQNQDTSLHVKYIWQSFVYVVHCTTKRRCACVCVRMFCLGKCQKCVKKQNKSKSAQWNSKRTYERKHCCVYNKHHTHSTHSANNWGRELVFLKKKFSSVYGKMIRRALYNLFRTFTIYSKKNFCQWFCLYCLCEVS